MAWIAVGNIRGPQGLQGVQGVPGAVGPASLVFKGSWLSGTAYAINDMVSGWGGSSYFATAAHAASGVTMIPPTGVAGSPAADDTAVNTGWAPLAIEGAQGIQGPAGTQGIQGPTGTGTPGATGATGPAGTTGTTGATGTAGARGSQWYTGTGVPTAGNTTGSVIGDMYLDVSTGDTYRL